MCYNKNGGSINLRRYYLVIWAFFLFFGMYHVDASCSYTDKVKLQKLAGNVLFSYQYHESNYGVTFDVTISNLTPNIYMVDRATGKVYRSNNQDIVITGYKSGGTNRFDFYATDQECTTDIIFTNYLTLPSFNPFYKEKVCEGASEYKLCQKWIKMDISYTEFYRLVYDYKQNKVDIEIEEEVPTESAGEQFFYFWEKYYLFVLGGILAICALGYYLYNRSLRM